MTHNKYTTPNVTQEINFCRSDCAGIGSHILVCCVDLAFGNFTSDVKINFNINLSNYNTSWYDLFEENTYISQNKTLITESKDIINIDIVNLYIKLNIPFHNRHDFDKNIPILLNKYYTKYFHIKQYIVDDIDRLFKKYDIANSTCVYFRGTDKYKESKRIEYDKYLQFIDSNISNKLWIQSDEIEFITYMKNKFPEKSFYIDEFNYSTSYTLPLHLSNTTTKNDAVEILIIMNLMSKAKKIIANISNVIHTALIIKGNVDNVNFVI